MFGIKGKLNSWELFIKHGWKGNNLIIWLAREDNYIGLKNSNLSNSFVGF